MFLVVVSGWKQNMTSTTWGSKTSMQIQHAEMCLELGSLETALHFPSPHSGTIGSLGQLMGNCHQQDSSERTILNCSLQEPEDWGRTLVATRGCPRTLSSWSVGELWGSVPSSPLMEWPLPISTPFLKEAEPSSLGMAGPWELEVLCFHKTIRNEGMCLMLAQ